MRRFFWSLMILLTVSCTAGVPAADSGNPCSLSLVLLVPTEAGTFTGLGEDADKCQMSSWREAFEDETPGETVIFVDDACSSQIEDGSLENPYCDLDRALEEAAEIIARDSEKIPALYLNPGAYSKNFRLKDALTHLEIRGLCSETTTVTAADEDTALFTVQAATASGKLSLYSVKLNGGNSLIIDIQNGTVEMESVNITLGNSEEGCFEIEGNSSSLTGSMLAIDGIAVAPAFSSPTSTVDGVVMPTIGSADVPQCIVVSDGGSLRLENFNLHDLEGVALLATGTDTTVELISGVISGTQPRSTGDYGYGLSIEDGAVATLDDVTLTENTELNLLVDGAGSSVEIENSYIGQASASVTTGSGVGLLVQNEAEGTIADSTVTENENPGIFVSAGGELTATDCSITGNGFANAVVVDATLTVTGSALDSSVSSPADGGGLALFIQGWTTDSTLVANISGNTMENNVSGIYGIERSGDMMSIDLDGNYVKGSTASHGITFISIPDGITLTENCIEDSQLVHLLLDNSTALLDENSYQGSYGTYTISQQRCGTNPAVSLASENLPNPTGACICGVNATTGAACNAFPTGPNLEYFFELMEASVAQ